MDIYDTSARVCMMDYGARMGGILYIVYSRLHIVH